MLLYQVLLEGDGALVTIQVRGVAERLVRDGIDLPGIANRRARLPPNAIRHGPLWRECLWRVLYPILFPGQQHDLDGVGNTLQVLYYCNEGVDQLNIEIQVESTVTQCC